MGVNNVSIAEGGEVNEIVITLTHVNLLRKIANEGRGFVWQQSGIFWPRLNDVYRLGESGACVACSKIHTRYFVDLINAGLLNYSHHDYPNNILRINRKWGSILELENI